MQNKYLQISIGIVLGLLLSVGVLNISEINVYMLWSVSTLLQVIIMCMIPLCLKVFLKSTFASCLMIATSFVVCIVYGLFVLTKVSSNYFTLMCILHVCAIITTLLIGKIK